MPAPPRNKLYNKTGKHKIINTSYGPSSSQTQQQAVVNHDNNTSAVLPDTEADRQLELELCWCIQTLETSLDTGKLNAKQAQDTDKTIKLLKSSAQPTIKKRQIMRASFGDYRAKMAEEERKLRLKQQQIHFTSAAVKSHFVKKSVLTELGKEYKFDFDLPAANAMERLDIDETAEPPRNGNETDIDKGSKPAAANTVTVLPVIPSTNSFRFNFAIEID